MVECRECGVVWECWVTFFIYLLVIVDEILGVVAIGGVLECSKSGMAVSVVVFAAACCRTADTFTTDMRTCGDALICLTRGLDK